MNAQRGSLGIAVLLPSALDGGWVVNATRRGALLPGKIPDTEFTGGWVGPGAGVVRCAENFASLRDSFPRPLVP